MIDELIFNAKESLEIRIYGLETPTLPTARNTDITSLGIGSEKPRLVRVTAIGAGASCVEVTPFFLLVAAGGIEPGGCAIKLPTDAKMWVLRRDAVTARLDSHSGSVIELLTQSVDLDGEPLAPIEVRARPTLAVKVTQRGPNDICVTWDASIVIQYRTFGGRWRTAAHPSFKGSECIADNICVKVIDSDLVSAKLCYEPKDKRMCLEGKVGYRGVGAKFRICHDV